MIQPDHTTVITSAAATRVTFMYWGRQGALPYLTLEVARAAAKLPGVVSSVSIARQNELFADYHGLEDVTLLPVSTFSNQLEALLASCHLAQLRRDFVHRLKDFGTQAVISLMPHVWSPLIIPAIRRSGIRYVSVIHDAKPHPGDPTARFMSWTLRDALHADLVVTLSEAVRSELLARRGMSGVPVHVLFHPDLCFGTPSRRSPPRPGELFRLLFLGRIQRYKGLGLLLDAVDDLQADGFPIEIGVYGAGPLEEHGPRLQRIGAEVVNRWLSEAEIGEALGRYHAVALSHIEASQSGVAAAAFGYGVPVIATPVGGLKEQIVDGVTGVMAESIDARAFARAIRRLATDSSLYEQITRNLAATSGARSVTAFTASLIELARSALPQNQQHSAPPTISARSA